MSEKYIVEKLGGSAVPLSLSRNEGGAIDGHIVDKNGGMVAETFSDIDAQLFVTSPDLLDNEIKNAEDADKALSEMTNEIPDMSLVYNCLCGIAGRSVDGAKKATGKTWEKIKELTNG